VMATAKRRKRIGRPPVARERAKAAASQKALRERHKAAGIRQIATNCRDEDRAFVLEICKRSRAGQDAADAARAMLARNEPPPALHGGVRERRQTAFERWLEMLDQLVPLLKAWDRAGDLERQLEVSRERETVERIFPIYRELRERQAAGGGQPEEVSEPERSGVLSSRLMEPQAQ